MLYILRFAPATSDWSDMGKRKSKKSESKAKPRKRVRKRVRKLLFLVVSGGAAALALSEPLRNKALDKLFGSEEQFQYTPPAASPSGEDK